MRILLWLVLLAAPAAASAQLTAPERRMIATVDREADRHVQLLEQHVNQNSGTLNLQGVRAYADMLKPEFEAIGMTVSWVDMSETGRAGHFIARTRTVRRNALGRLSARGQLNDTRRRSGIVSRNIAMARRAFMVETPPLYLAAPAPRGGSHPSW